MRSSSAIESTMISISLLIARLSMPSSLALPFTSSISGGTPASSAQRVSKGEATSIPTPASAASRNTAGWVEALPA